MQVYLVCFVFNSDFLCKCIGCVLGSCVIFLVQVYWVCFVFMCDFFVQVYWVCFGFMCVFLCLSIYFTGEVWLGGVPLYLQQASTLTLTHNIREDP